MANNKKPDALDSVLKSAGVEAPQEDQIDIDSYMEGMDPDMAKMLQNMRRVSKETMDKAEKNLNVPKKEEPVEEPKEIKVTDEVIAKERFDNTVKMINDVRNSAQDAEFDEAIKEEKERAEYYAQHPEADPNFHAVRTTTGEEVAHEAPVAEEDAVGTVLGDSYNENENKNENPEDAIDDADDTLSGEDFIPDIEPEDDESEKTDKKEEEAKSEESEDDDEDENMTEMESLYKNQKVLEKEFLDMPEVKIEPDKSPMVKVVQRRTEINTDERGGKTRVKELGDDAFLNALTKARRKTFRIVEIPLLNSGFTVELNGLGPGDLYSLYSLIETYERGSLGLMEYMEAQMKTIAKAIVRIRPYFDPSKLHSMVHYADLNLLMYGIVTATLDDAKYPVDSCPNCGKSFRITIPSTDIILNKDELQDRIDKIKNAESIAENSLLKRHCMMRFESGYEVLLGHASVADQYKLMKSMNSYTNSNKLTEVDKIELVEYGYQLAWIRSIVGPTGLKAKGAYQTVKMLTMMDDDERRQIVENIIAMQKDLIPIQLGVKNVKCPHCGKVIPEIPTPGLGNLVFFQRLASQGQVTQESEKN